MACTTWASRCMPHVRISFLRSAALLARQPSEESSSTLINSPQVPPEKSAGTKQRKRGGVSSFTDVMSKPTDSGGKRRRSTGFLARNTLSALTPIHDAFTSNAAAVAAEKKTTRPASFFTHSTMLDGEGRSPRDSDGSTEPPRNRPRTLIKNGRPTSIFGSLRSMRSTEEEEQLTSPASKASSIDEERLREPVPHGGVVLHHGEVQTTGGMFRKRKEYLVLTDTHLLRFKSYSRAAEAFPS